MPRPRPLLFIAALALLLVAVFPPLAALAATSEDPGISSASRNAIDARLSAHLAGAPDMLAPSSSAAPTTGADSGAGAGPSASQLAGMNDAELLEHIFTERLGNNSVGALATSHYCTCPRAVATSPLICRTIQNQCRTSFCSPLCLTSLAWRPRVSIDCSRAPTWSWCPAFARQLKAALPAITAQFRAHTCLSDGLCSSASDPLVSNYLAEHTEDYGGMLSSFAAAAAAAGAASAGAVGAGAAINGASALFGAELDPVATAAAGRQSLEDTEAALSPWGGRGRSSKSDAFTLPRTSRLPIPSCSPHAPPMSSPSARAQVCTACEAIVTVSLEHGSCEPAGAPHTTLAAPPARGSLRDRCLFVRDAISARARPLLKALRASVCSCAGCCGEGQCWFSSGSAGGSAGTGEQHRGSGGSDWGGHAVRAAVERVVDHVKSDAADTYALSAGNSGSSAVGGWGAPPAPPPPTKAVEMLSKGKQYVSAAAASAAAAAKQGARDGRMSEADAAAEAAEAAALAAAAAGEPQWPTASGPAQQQQQQKKQSPSGLDLRMEQGPEGIPLEGKYLEEALAQQQRLVRAEEEYRQHQHQLQQEKEKQMEQQRQQGRRQYPDPHVEGESGNVQQGPEPN